MLADECFPRRGESCAPFPPAKLPFLPLLLFACRAFANDFFPNRVTQRHVSDSAYGVVSRRSCIPTSGRFVWKTLHCRGVWWGALDSQGKPLPREESNEPATVLGRRRVCLRSTHWAFPCPENVNKSPSFAAVPHRQHVRFFGSIVKRTDDTKEHWTRTAGAGLCFGNLVLATPLEGTGQTASKSTRMFPLNKTHQCSV